ncbi:Fic family protein [Candidatus Woesearchaeota archaeon]|nr:Fic family protein [Candidatus Woesearchaeota archaeon]
MVFISRKRIQGKDRFYLEKSVRLPNGKVKKFSVYLKGYSPKGKYGQLSHYKRLLEARVSEELVEFAVKNYEKSSIFNERLLRELEEIRLGYKRVIKKLSLEQLQDVIERFTVNFTYESNAIEGNSLTLKDVAVVLHEKKAIEGKDLREIYETLNTRDAMELVFNNKLKITERDIILLHKILVKNTGVATGYKTLPNFLLGREIETTPPELVPQEISKLVNWFNGSKKVHPLQSAASFHAGFEKIHPFEDGNGRVGRLLINVMLVNNGYPPLIIRKTQRLAYLAALEAFDNGYEDKLRRFLVEKYKKTYEKFFLVYVKYLK